MTLSFEEFYKRGIVIHLKERKRLDTQLLNFVLYTEKDGKRKVSPIISTDSSPMDHAQGVIDKLQPDMYLICAESWCSQQKNIDEFEKKYYHGKVKEQANRYEAMIFIAKSMDGKKTHTEWYKIHKDSKGKIERYEQMPVQSFETTKLT